MLHKSLRICGIAVVWALAWGATGAGIGVIVTLFQPDTGHIPTKMMPVLIGVPSAVFGLGAGLLYGVLAIGFGLEAGLGKKGLTVLGASISLASGAIFMVVLAHSYVTVFAAVALGVLLVAAFSQRSAHGK